MGTFKTVSKTQKRHTSNLELKTLILQKKGRFTFAVIKMYLNSCMSVTTKKKNGEKPGKNRHITYSVTSLMIMSITNLFCDITDDHVNNIMLMM